jgi:hypothetical protein
MLHNQPTGPIIIRVCLTCNIYLQFLQNELLDLLEGVPLETRLPMHFVLNGASPLFSRAVKEYSIIGSQVGGSFVVVHNFAQSDLEN